jgi:hypothetical protein
MNIFMLHEKIAEVCPIDGVAKRHDGTYRIDYRAEATTEQREAAQAIVGAWPLHEARAAAAERVQTGHTAALAAGVTVGQIKLRAEASDQIALANGLNVANAALIAGTSNSVNVSNIFGRGVTDYDNNSHDMTLAQYLQLSLGYANAIGTLQATLALKTAQANAAETIEAAQAIDW